MPTRRYMQCTCLLRLTPPAPLMFTPLDFLKMLLHLFRNILPNESIQVDKAGPLENFSDSLECVIVSALICSKKTKS